MSQEKEIAISTEYSCSRVMGMFAEGAMPKASFAVE